MNKPSPDKTLRDEFAMAAKEMLAGHKIEASRDNFERCGCRECLTFQPLVEKWDRLK